MEPVDTELLRAINRYRVLDAIRRFGPLSRADICQQTKLEAGETLGLGIANLINVIDPGKVIITGGGVRTADLIEPSVRHAVETYSVKAVRGRCEIVFHDWSDEVLARGAAALVLQGLYRNPWSRSTAIAVAG